MTSKFPWVAAAIIIVVAAVGAWAIMGTATAPAGETGVWRELGVPGQAYGFPEGSKSGIVAIHFMRHGSGYSLSDNLATYTQSNDNRIGSLTASGQTISTFPYDTAFDIIVDVAGHDDNMGQLNINYLMVELQAHKDTGWTLGPENSLNTQETVYSSPAGYIFVNVLWDNSNSGYTISADDNLYLDNVKLWLRG